MSSKSAENQATSTPAISSWSITRRLAILYALSAFLILALSSILLYLGLAKGLERRDQHHLLDEVNVLRTILQNRGERVLNRRIETESSALEFIVHSVRLLDPEGRTILETPGMTADLPAAMFPSPGAAATPFEEIRRGRTAAGASFLLSAVRVDQVKDSEPRILQVAMDATSGEILLSHYRRGLAAVLVLGVVASALVGILVARRGLRPLRQITELTRSISADRLDQRINCDRWPKELGALADSFDRMLDRLQDSFIRLSHCTSNLAHELRTPINNLMGEAEVLLARERSPAEYRKTIESSLEEYGRLSRIFDGLLFLARAANGIDTLSRTEFPVMVEVEKVREYFEPLAEESRIGLSCRGEGVLVADPGLVRRAVTNLISNALKFTPPGGEVAVEVQSREDGSVRIAVSDTGQGIPAEHLPRVCDRFYRVEGSPARPGTAQGFGLGLAIVQSIMELHGGQILLDSRPGAGTTATLVFPPAQ